MNLKTIYIYGSSTESVNLIRFAVESYYMNIKIKPVIVLLDASKSIKLEESLKEYNELEEAKEFLIAYDSEKEDFILLQNIDGKISNFRIVHVKKFKENAEKLLTGGIKLYSKTLTDTFKEKEDFKNEFYLEEKKKFSKLPLANVPNMIDMIGVPERLFLINYEGKSGVSYYELQQIVKRDYGYLHIQPMKVDSQIKNILYRYSNSNNDMINCLDNGFCNEVMSYDTYKMDTKKTPLFKNKMFLKPNTVVSPIISFIPLPLLKNKSIVEINEKKMADFVNRDVPIEIQNKSLKDVSSIKRNLSLSLEEIQRMTSKLSYIKTAKPHVYDEFIVRKFSQNEEKFTWSRLNNDDCVEVVIGDLESYLEAHKTLLKAVFSLDKKTLDKFGVNLSHYNEKEVEKFIEKYKKM